ncbi:MAG: hypothetical protein U0939_26380 [Pirellulales bacterium]
MADLYLSLVVMTVLSAAMFAMVQRASRRLSPSALNASAVLVVVLMVAYILLVWDRWWLSRLFPYANLIVVGNWFPLWSAALAALIWRRTAHQPWRRACDVGALAVVALFSLVAPFLGRPPECGAEWMEGRYCLQTTPVTCTPASAATLLRHYGIDATEQEMAELCLTRRGTTWQGLYHGLKRKTAGTAWDVEVSRIDLASLQALSSQSAEPLLLRVGLSAGAEVGPEFERELGWRPGTGHSVVFLRFLAHNMVEVADPTPGIGREQWTVEEFKTLWDGQVVRLVPVGQASSLSRIAQR